MARHRLCRATVVGRLRLAVVALLMLAAAVPVHAAPSPPIPPIVPATPATLTTPIAPAALPLPADSIYQLPVLLTDQTGHSFRLDERRGQPMLISMFFTSCQFVCPMLTDALRDTAAKLQAGEREQLKILMVSFDPAHDSVAVLKRTADQHRLDSPQWTLARADDKSVRKLAAVLGIQYRALSNGDFNHTTALILIDADGRIAGRTAQLGVADAAFVKLVKAAAQSQGR